MVNEFKEMNNMKEKMLTVRLALLYVLSTIGFNAAVSFAGEGLVIHFLATSRSYTATMQINDKAADVWQSVVDVAKKRNPDNLNIKKEDKENLKFVASKMTESGEELMASLKVSPDSETSCRLIFTATMGGNKPLEKDMKAMVTDTLMQFCDEKGLTCNIVE
jgi:hypothetical protein